MTYAEFRERQMGEVNEFPMAAAFNKEQLDEAVRKLDAKSTDELVHIAGGMLVRKDKQQALLDMFKRHEAEWNAAMKDDGFLEEAFIYEMGNHEYCITMDPYDTLSALQISEKQFALDARLQSIFSKAEKEYLKNADW